MNDISLLNTVRYGKVHMIENHLILQNRYTETRRCVLNVVKVATITGSSDVVATVTTSMLITTDNTDSSGNGGLLYNIRASRGDCLTYTTCCKEVEPQHYPS